MVVGRLLVFSGLVSGIFIAGCAMQTAEQVRGVGGKGKVLLVIAPSDFRDEELFDTRREIESAGYATFLASTRKGEARGMLGGRATASLHVSEANISEYAAIVFVGGIGVEENLLYEDEDVLRIARESVGQNKVVGAICIAPRILARAGVVKGKRVTSYPDGTTKSMLADAGAMHTGADVQVDGKIITADGPKSATKFGREIARLLESS
ncbi:MAG: DJ-1/PfpI family protein [Candidatus Micrarchaeia archaeon]